MLFASRKHPIPINQYTASLFHQSLTNLSLVAYDHTTLWYFPFAFDLNVLPLFIENINQLSKILTLLLLIQNIISFNYIL